MPCLWPLTLEGYPYVGLVALTFLTEPAVDFSITPDSILGGAVSASWLLWLRCLLFREFFLRNSLRIYLFC